MVSCLALIGILGIPCCILGIRCAS